MSDPILQGRDREVLRAIVDSFIQTGEPVGSRTVSREHPEARSAATIRNVMADLEQGGFVSQPHASAGRVPTERGLRYYIEELLEPQPLGAAERDSIELALRSRGDDAAVLLESVPHLLAELSRNVGLVLIPAFSQRVFERFSFVRVQERRIAALFVSRPGLVDHRVMDVPQDYTQEELDRISNYLSEEFRGMPLSRIRVRLLEMMTEEKAQYDGLMREALELGARSLEKEGDGDDLIVEGTPNILDPQVFASADRMKKLFQAFEEKSRLVSLLNQCLDEKGWKLFIGSQETGTPEMEGCALVVSPYHDGLRPVGTVGILGPTRMEYARAISLVDTLARLLTQALSGPEAPHEGEGRRRSR
jgi:heat-inducible transcriptional repressor